MKMINHKKWLIIVASGMKQSTYWSDRKKYISPETCLRLKLSTEALRTPGHAEWFSKTITSISDINAGTLNDERGTLNLHCRCLLPENKGEEIMPKLLHLSVHLGSRPTTQVGWRSRFNVASLNGFFAFLVRSNSPKNGQEGENFEFIGKFNCLRHDDSISYHISHELLSTIGRGRLSSGSFEPLVPAVDAADDQFRSMYRKTATCCQ